MQIVILAAGLGSRLPGGAGPKALTALSDGRSILEYQLEQIALYADWKQVTVVVGYQQEKIRSAFPQLHYVENPHYAAQNTSKSLLRAIQTLEGADLLWLNGDVIFRHRVLKPLFERKNSCMVVNRAPVGQEEVKYRTDGAGLLLEVSKQVKQPEGEAIGVNFFCQADLPALKAALDACAEQDYFEKGIELCIQQGSKIWAETIEKADCIEIDFLEDLQAANKLILSWD